MESSDAWWRRDLPRWLSVLFALMVLFLFVDALAYSQSTYAGPEYVTTCLGQARLKSRDAASAIGEYGVCMKQNLSSIADRWVRITKKESYKYDKPCHFVGEWYSWRDGVIHIINMQANGRFTARPLNRDTGSPDSGVWKYKDGAIRWDYDWVKIDPPDVNKVVDEVAGGFSLIEVNHSRTVFRAVDKHMNHCATR